MIIMFNKRVFGIKSEKDIEIMSKKKSKSGNLTDAKIKRMKEVYDSLENGTNKIWDEKISSQSNKMSNQAEYNIYTDIDIINDKDASLSFPPIEVQAIVRVWMAQNDVYNTNIDIIEYSVEEKRVRVIVVLPSLEKPIS